ncbi:PD-(D/E)XK nuclease superfamily protein [uncultured archaeon]|nr:PD-(D/E)XK nuclease superfamily protein [uncultured archaeon]
MKYSYSRLQCFENCPLSFRFRYIDKLEVEAFETIEAFMGSRVHEALEKFYIDRNHGKIASIEELIVGYNDLWKRYLTPDIVVNKEGLTPEHYRIVGEKCLIDYYNRYKPFAIGKTLSTEVMVNIDLLGDGEHQFIGYIDRLDAVNDGVYEIHDYKTSQHLPTQDQKDRDQQLALYEIGIRQMWDDIKEVDLIWHYLVFDKEIRSKRTSQHLEDLKQEFLNVIKRIEEAEAKDDYPAIESGLCSWCAYQEHCKLKKHQVKTKQLPLNKYMTEEGVVLANKYSELKAKEKEFTDWFEGEYNQLAEALIAYAKKEGVEFIYGTDKRVRVAIKEALKFPAAETPERQKLEEILKKDGFWEDVSTLNIRGLEKKIQEHEFPSQLEKILKKYATTEETTRLTLSKIKEND